MNTNPKLLDRPFLIGKKVYLRPMEPEDVNDRYLQWLNDSEVVLGKTEVHFPMTREKQSEYVRSLITSKDNVFFCIMEKSSNSFIGTIKIGPINWIHRFAYQGTMIGDKTKWNKGYASESAFLIMEYAFRHLNLHKMYAGVYAPNQASIKKNEKAGYKIEAVFKDKLFINGKYTDHIIMSQSQEEFLKVFPEPEITTFC